MVLKIFHLFSNHIQFPVSGYMIKADLIASGRSPWEEVIDSRGPVALATQSAGKGTGALIDV
jgi:hypothetical protein